MVGVEAMESDSGDGNLQISLPITEDPRVPLTNLSVLRRKMDSLQQFLAESVDRSTLLGKDQMDMVSSEITSAIRQIIVNGAALLSCSQPPSLRSQIDEDDNVRIVGGVVDPAGVRIAESSLVSVPNLVGSITGKMCELGGSARLGESVDLTVQSIYYPIVGQSKEPTYVRNHRSNVLDFRTSTMDPLTHEELKDAGDIKDVEMKEEIDDGECEIVELDAVDILAEHIHICEICGKGFKRDANLRMHMRAHGNQFKTPEALAKPDRSVESSRRIRFSCPFKGCNRNKSHKRFRPLKSAICVKNHFKRSHCPKMFSCHLCNKKNFSVVADLKSHLRHCGESKWRCSCGTTFSRKDKLFGHVALFEGHMPAFTEEDEKFKEAIAIEECGETEKEDAQLKAELIRNGSDNGFFDRLLEGFGSIDDVCFKDAFGSPGLDKEQQELYEIL